MDVTRSVAPASLPRTLAAIAANACVVRYRLNRSTGILHVLAAVSDPFVYAGTVYFVLATIFGRDEAARFHLLALGFIAFRWTLSCLIQALKLRTVRDRLAEVTRYDYVGTIVAIMAPPTMAFLLSLALALGWTMAAASESRSLAALWTLPGVILVQGLWNVILVLAIDQLQRARIVLNEIMIIAFAVIVWFLSPFMYRLDEIPASASRILTSFNPVSHVIAAYQNAYWYGRVPSLNVLPATGLATIGGIGLMWWLNKRYRARGISSAFSATPNTSPQIIIVTNGAPRLAVVQADPKMESPRVFSRWQGRIDDYPASGMVRLILAARGVPFDEMQRHLGAIQEASRVGRLFHEDMALHPDWARDQLAFTCAMLSSSRNLVFDGLLNSALPDFIASAWFDMENESKAGRAISVIADHPILLPATASGTFRLIGPAGVIKEGRLGADAYKLSEALWDEKGAQTQKK